MSLTSLSSLSDHETPRPRRNNPVKFDAFAEYGEVAFSDRFRLNKETVLHLADILKGKLKSATERNRAIQPIDQILITLRFFATGDFQKTIGDLFYVQQPTVHRIVHKVAAAIARLKADVIYMPRTEQERMQIASNFFTIAEFPRVLGAIDCTRVEINSPGGPTGELFRNRKTKFSINVQMVSDGELRIRNIIARWPGSAHDSTIFNDSPICAEFERGDFGSYLLLGDAGYPCRSYLLTPFSNPQTSAERNYNRAQIATRNPVERLYGVLKRRFPCLRGMRVKVDKVPVIIVACAVLHNIAINMNDTAISFDDELDTESDDDSDYQQTLTNSNFGVRNYIMQAYFA